MKQRITAVVAAGLNEVIGWEGDLPWHLPDDLRFFMHYTLGKPVLMGRKTFESIGQKPLPRRTNAILSSQLKSPEDGTWIAVPDLTSALALFSESPEIIVAGGAGLYAATAPLLTDIRMTRVHAQPHGTVFFPISLQPPWVLREKIQHPKDEKHAYAFDFEHWERVG